MDAVSYTGVMGYKIFSSAFIKILYHIQHNLSRNSAEGIATGYGLDDRGRGVGV
jgi:hypothetical protein